jgi:hypothetical protein
MKGIPATKKFVSDLATAVGLVVVGFAQFEFSLNNAMEIIYEYAGGRETIQPELPRNLTNRIQFMKDSARKLPKLCSYRAEILALMATAMKISKTRDHIIHGYVSEYDKKTKILVFIKADPERPTMSRLKLDTLRIAIPALVGIGDATLDLAIDMAQLCSRIEKAFVR